MNRHVIRLIAAAVFAVACFRADQAAWLGQPETIAPGIDLFRTTDETLLDPAGPVAVYLLRLDPDEVRIEGALANDEIVGAERVDALARRRKALAAVNAGFFNVKNGEPVGLLKIAGELVSDTSLTRGVVAIQSPPGGTQQLDFDQASVKVEARFRMGAQPASAVRRDLGKTPIPRDGLVLSFGGLEPPSPLDWLAAGTEVTIVRHWTALLGTPAERFESARDVINGAGLLRKDGKALSGWPESEGVQATTFVAVRHPRTVIGTDRRGNIWLIAIDGRQPSHSLGMTFTELLALCARLDLVNALNLDGGGSTTMVAKDAIVNKPSDAAGPRAVSDAILVYSR